MSIFFYILIHNILPIFILIALGFALDKVFPLNISTLSKVIFYLFSPGFIIVNLYTTPLNTNMLKIFLMCIVLMVLNDLLSRVIGKIRKFDMGMTNAFKNSIIFNNSGNIGLSLITLVFSSGPYLINGQTPYLGEALNSMITIMVYVNITLHTLGFYFAGRATLSFKGAIIQIFKMPPIYVVLLTLLLKKIPYDLTGMFFWPSVEYLKNALIAVALVTLGAQLSKTKFRFKDVNAYLSAFTRLIVVPLIALPLILLFRFGNVTAQTALIALSAPTSVNTALIAAECKNYEDFSTQAVLISTFFSMFTLTLIIYAARVLFPL